MMEGSMLPRQLGRQKTANHNRGNIEVMPERRRRRQVDFWSATAWIDS